MLVFVSVCFELGSNYKVLRWTDEGLGDGGRMYLGRGSEVDHDANSSQL